MRTCTPLALAMALVAGAGHAQNAQWTEHRPLPTPRGPYGIGTYVARLADTAHFPDGRNIERPVTVQVWYPAGRTTSGSAAPYVESSRLVDSMIANKYLDLPNADMHRWNALPLAARIDAPALPAPSRQGWPVVVFSHGFGVSRANYAALCQELASRGYVVLAVDHPYGGFMLAPSGRVLQPGGDSLRRRLGSDSIPASIDSALAWDVRTWAAEAGRSLRHVARDVQQGRTPHGPRLDTAHVGMLGHSLGGAAALQACLTDPIFKACGDMDGLPVGDVERLGVGKPMLVLLSQPGGPKAAPKDSADREQQARFAQMGHERDSTFEAIRGRYPAVFSRLVKLKGTGHMSFTDAPFLMPSLLEGTGSTLSAERAHRLIADQVLAFFERFLRSPAKASR